MNINTTLKIQACLSSYTLNFHETVFTISDGTIDLLSAIGIPDSKRGISYSVGLDGAPAFEFKENAVIKEPAQAYFKDQIYKDFAIGITVKPYKRTGGFLFAVKNLYNTVVQFGVELTGNQLKLHYTLEARYAKSSTVIATFDIGDIYNKWTKLSIKVKDNAVTLYKNCANLGSVVVQGGGGPMDVEGGANLYVGRAGDNFNNVFAVSPVCFAALLEFKWFLCNGINCEMTRGIKQSVYILQSLLDLHLFRNIASL